MKSSAITLAVTLILSSSSTISGMPHQPFLVTIVPLSMRVPTYLIKRSLLDGQSTDHVPNALLKRAHEDKNEAIQYRLEDLGDKVNGIADEHYKNDSNHTNHTRGPPPTKSNSHPIPARLSPVLVEKSSNDNKSLHPESEYNHSVHPTKSVKNYSDHSENYGEHRSNSSYHGKATYFAQGGNPGACGNTHQDSDYIVAIQSEMYEGGKFCGKTILVTRKSTGQSIKCIAADACPGCPSNQSLDLSIAAFKALGDQNEGIFDISWEVVESK